MTAQIPDTVIAPDGTPYYPVQLLRHITGQRVSLTSGVEIISTACWDGYLHQYSIGDEGALRLEWVILSSPRKEPPPPAEFCGELAVLPEEVKKRVWQPGFFMEEEEGKTYYGYLLGPLESLIFLKGCQFLLRNGEGKISALLRIDEKAQASIKPLTRQ